MSGDECARIDPAAGVFAIARSDEWRREFAHFEMKVRPVYSAGGPDRRDLFAAMHLLLSLHHDRFDVAIVRLHEFPRPVFLVSVKDDDDIAPARARFPRKQHLAIRYCEDRIPQVAIFAADSIQVVAEMSILGEGLGVIGERAVLAPDREIETRGGR